MERVKQVYKQLDLKKVYSDYEEETYQELMQLISKLSGTLPADMFIAFAQKIYKRKS